MRSTGSAGAKACPRPPPLVDWNQDGYVDFAEFAGTARSLFVELDRDGDGRLTPKEMGTAAPAPQKPQ